MSTRSGHVVPLTQGKAAPLGGGSEVVVKTTRSCCLATPPHWRTKSALLFFCHSQQPSQGSSHFRENRDTLPLYVHVCFGLKSFHYKNEMKKKKKIQMKNFIDPQRGIMCVQGEQTQSKTNTCDPVARKCPSKPFIC